MTNIAYITKRFSAASQQIIDTANDIILEYQQQGFDLTLRQLYYQFVARDVVPNTERSYKRIGSIVNDARMAGMISWRAIQDRTRYLRGYSHDNNPRDTLEEAAQAYSINKWEPQDWYVEVWVEKDALIDVVQSACQEKEVSFFSCRGYVSQSEMWSAAQRFARKDRQDKSVKVIHLGDHDPSGIDMTRDIEERLSLLSGYADITVERIALNMDQVVQYNPPPNPAKLTDSRSGAYTTEHGYESWELDALEPSVMVELIQSKINEVVDNDLWEQEENRENEERNQIMRLIETI